MKLTAPTRILTHTGAMTMLAAAIEAADHIGQPQCITIVDTGGTTIAELRMNGAKFLSLKSARAKALTAASTGGPSTNIPDGVAPLIGLATAGSVTGLPGGLPIIIGGILVGGLGVGSGTGDQDIYVANAALRAVEGETFE